MFAFLLATSCNRHLPAPTLSPTLLPTLSQDELAPPPLSPEATPSADLGLSVEQWRNRWNQALDTSLIKPIAAELRLSAVPTQTTEPDVARDLGIAYRADIPLAPGIHLFADISPLLMLKELDLQTEVPLGNTGATGTYTAVAWHALIASTLGLNVESESQDVTSVQNDVGVVGGGTSIRNGIEFSGEHFSFPGRGTYLKFYVKPSVS